MTALGLWTPPVCCASVFSQLAFRLHFRSEIPYISNICSSKAGRPWASSQQIVEGKKYISLLTHFTSQETRSTKSKVIGRHQDFADDVNPTEKSSQMNVLSQTEEGKWAEQKIASRCAVRSSRCVAWRWSSGPLRPSAQEVLPESHLWDLWHEEDGGKNGVNYCVFHIIGVLMKIKSSSRLFLCNF